MKKKAERNRKLFPWRQIVVLLLLSVAILFLLRDHGDMNHPSEPSWIIRERGLINGFKEGLIDEDGDIVNCEASAIVYDGTNLIMASDKPIPSDSQNKRSSVFYVEYSNFRSQGVKYYTTAPFVEAIKYEDFTITPDGRYVIVTTAFDRVHYSGSSEWDHYNTMLIWAVGKPDTVTLVCPSTKDGVTSSVGLREKISSALVTQEFPEGAPYFKIEGLAAIPGNRLLLGVRELGKSYKEFDYAMKIISVSYNITNGKLLVSDDFRLAYEYDPSERKAELGNFTVALSSIEYDRYHDRLYLLTSYENESDGKVTDEDIGAFLWVLPIDRLDTGKAPDLVLKQSDSSPLRFAHKGEGVAVINKERIFIIHDDDRVLGRTNIENPETQFSRQHNQAAYTIVDLVDSNDG